MGDKWEDKCENSCGPRHPEWETNVADKYKIMRPKVTQSGRQVWKTSVGDKCGRQVWETSVNSCGPRHPEWETSVGDKCGRQV